MTESSKIMLHNGNVVWDFEHDMLISVSRYIDQQLAALWDNMRKHEWLKENWLDPCEYLAGIGFVAGQRFISASYPRSGLKRVPAISIGPKHKASGWPIPAIVDAAANYWKHHDEWDKDPTTGKWEVNDLNGRAARVLTALGCFNERFTCAEVLSVLAEGELSPFMFLAKHLKEWNESLLRQRQTKAEPRAEGDG